MKRKRKELKKLLKSGRPYLKMMTIHFETRKLSFVERALVQFLGCNRKCMCKIMINF